VLVGLLFKVGAVPFHMWTPDVYQGAPTPVTGFMAAGTKAAAFGAILRFVYVGVDRAAWDWRPALIVVAALTMIVGAVLSVTQTDMKRLLAYSSIAHAGFILVGVLSMERTGVSGVLFYLAAYGLTTIAAFAIVGLVREGGSEATHLSQWTGLGKRHPVDGGRVRLPPAGVRRHPADLGLHREVRRLQAGSGERHCRRGPRGPRPVVQRHHGVRLRPNHRPHVLHRVSGRFRGGRRAVGLHHRDGRDGTLFTLVLGVAPASVLLLAERASQFIR
jgi:NADH-quinone oxidoreductase subunit N